MATEWQLGLGCDTTNGSNQFVAVDPENLWQSRTLGTTQWNDAGNGTPQAGAGDNVYVSVVDAGGSTSQLVGVLIASKAEGHSNQADVTPFRMNGGNSGPKAVVISATATPSGSTWVFGPYSVQQTGSFELTFAGNLVSPRGSEQSDSWEEDPEFDVVETP